MLLIPAIDLKDGRCVRLRQGRMGDATVYSDDPLAMADRWFEAGCRRLHIVDLDGAFAGQPKNRELIARIVRRIPGVPVQIGGGIRSVATAAAYFEAGAAAVIVGTRAIEDPEFLPAMADAYPGRVIFGLDARGDRAATAGWDVTSAQSPVDLALRAEKLDLAGIVYTDIERDGMLTGLNIETTLALARATRLPVTASGGVNDLHNLARLRQADEQAGRLLFGAITGRAIYAGTLDFRTGQELLDG